MRITLLSFTPEKVPTANGSYSKSAVAYKDDQGKVVGKNIVDFAHKKVYETLAKATPGETFDVKNEKIGNNWNWTEITRVDAGSPVPAENKANSVGGGSASPKSTYETPEERAKKQVYIVRQSSLSAAINLLGIGAKAAPIKEEVVKVAKYFESYVLDTEYDDGSIHTIPQDNID